MTADIFIRNLADNCTSNVNANVLVVLLLCHEGHVRVVSSHRIFLIYLSTSFYLNYMIATQVSL